MWHAKGAGGLRCVLELLTVGRSPYVAPRGAGRLGCAVSVFGLLPTVTPLTPGRLVSVCDELSHGGVVTLTDNVAA